MTLTINTKFNIGDTVFVPACYYELYAQRESYTIKDILINVRCNKTYVRYEIEQDGCIDIVSENWTFATYEECEEWCREHT